MPYTMGALTKLGQNSPRTGRSVSERTTETFPGSGSLKRREKDEDSRLPGDRNGEGREAEREAHGTTKGCLLPSQFCLESVLHVLVTIEERSDDVIII